MPDEPVPTNPAEFATTIPEAFKFVFSRRVGHWEPKERKLTIGGRTVWVPATLPIPDLEAGAKIVASGQKRPDGRWIMTQLTRA
jgi:hypothetical protein